MEMEKPNGDISNNNEESEILKNRKQIKEEILKFLIGHTVYETVPENMKV
jgi:hypothetical protein